MYSDKMELMVYGSIGSKYTESNAFNMHFLLFYFRFVRLFVFSFPRKFVLVQKKERKREGQPTIKTFPLLTQIK